MPRAEAEVKDFLASQPGLIRKALEEGLSSFTPEDLAMWPSMQDSLFAAREKYEQIISKMPARWNRYCKIQKDELEDTRRIGVRLFAPRGQAGRPSNDIVADAAIKLRNSGKNPAQVADALKKRFNKTYTPDAIRKLIKRREARTNSDK